MSESCIPSNKQLFDQRIEQEINSVINQFYGELPPLSVPIVKKYVDPYLNIGFDYVNYCIDQSFPEGVEVSMEQGIINFKNEVSKLVTPLIDKKLATMNLDPMIVEILKQLLSQITL